jgi:hypothetical protein
MFSSSKILFATSPVVESTTTTSAPVTSTTTTTASPVPLRITAQPQNVTLKAGSTSTIGQTTWATGSGYKRTMVRWERSLDGVNWYQETGYNSNLQSGGFEIPAGANRAQSGLKYRAYAYAYAEYTRLDNYRGDYIAGEGQSYETLDNLGNQGGKLILWSTRHAEDFAFIFLKGGQFRINIYFNDDRGRINNFTYLRASIGNRNVAYLKNIPALFDPRTGFYSMAENQVQNVEFTATPGELMSFDLGPTNNFPGITYEFNVVSVGDEPYASQKIVSDPFTLTVTP